MVVEPGATDFRTMARRSRPGRIVDGRPGLPTPVHGVRHGVFVATLRRMGIADVTELNPLVAVVEITAWPTSALVSEAHHSSRGAPPGTCGTFVAHHLGWIFEGSGFLLSLDPPIEVVAGGCERVGT